MFVHIYIYIRVFVVLELPARPTRANGRGLLGGRVRGCHDARVRRHGGRGTGTRLIRGIAAKGERRVSIACHVCIVSLHRCRCVQGASQRSGVTQKHGERVPITTSTSANISARNHHQRQCQSKAFADHTRNV